MIRSDLSSNGFSSCSRTSNQQNVSSHKLLCSLFDKVVHYTTHERFATRKVEDTEDSHVALYMMKLRKRKPTKNATAPKRLNDDFFAVYS